MRRFGGVLLAMSLVAGVARGEDVDPHAATRLVPATANGNLVYRVYVFVRNPGADEARDEDLRRAVAEAFPLQAGASFDEILAEQGVREVRELPGIADAEYRVYKSPEGGKIWVAILVRAGSCTR